MKSLEHIMYLAAFIWQTEINSSHLLSFDHGCWYSNISCVLIMSFSLTQPQCATPVFVDEGIFLVLTPNNNRALDDNE